LLIIVLCCQIALLAYHQITTLFDFYPFNSARHYSLKEKIGEAGFNAVMMSLPPIGFGFHIRGLIIFGLIYYYFLFTVEIIIWWVLYLTEPKGRWRTLHNRLLGAVMFNDPRADTTARWMEFYNRLHRDTIKILPPRGDRPVPNLEHTILHAWTLVTAIVTTVAFCKLY
jgi:hypothetical protein